MTPGPHLVLLPPPGAEPARVPAAAPRTLDEVFRAYSAYVATIGARILGRDDETDDLVQDVFVEAARGLPWVRDPAAVRGWLATVTVRVASRRLRARRVRRFFGVVGAEAAMEMAAWGGADPERCALLARVYELLDRVPARHRIAWILRTVEGEEVSRVAELCGCSLATAKRWIAGVQAFIESKTADVAGPGRPREGG